MIMDIFVSVNILRAFCAAGAWYLGGIMPICPVFAGAWRFCSWQCSAFSSCSWHTARSVAGRNGVLGWYLALNVIHRLDFIPKYPPVSTTGRMTS